MRKHTQRWPMSRKAGLAVVGLGAIFLAGATCPNTTSPGVLPGSRYPRTVAWTPRLVDDAANTLPAAVETRDFDGDNRLDIVAGYRASGTVLPSVSIFFQNTTGVGFTAVQIASTADLIGITALAVADMDGDLNADILAACEGRLVYLHSPADPRQAAGWNATVLDQSTGANIGQWNDIDVGDIDGLNGPDIVACGVVNDRLSWFRSPAADAATGAGWLRIDIDAAARSGAAAVALQDVDGDARLDVCSTAPGETQNRVVWYENPADPQLAAWVRFPVGNLAGVSRMEVSDIDSDGRLDIVAMSPTTRQVVWYRHPLNPANAWAGFVIAAYTSATPLDFQVGDIAGHNLPDVVVVTDSPVSLRWFTPIVVQTDLWLENNLADPTDSIGGRIAIGDVNADSFDDVVVPHLGADPTADHVTWYENPEQ